MGNINECCGKPKIPEDDSMDNNTPLKMSSKKTNSPERKCSLHLIYQ